MCGVGAPTPVFLFATSPDTSPLAAGIVARLCRSSCDIQGSGAREEWANLAPVPPAATSVLQPR